MKPTIANLRPVNPILTNVLISYMNDESDFVATRAAPIVPVNEENGTYFTFSKKYWFADQLERRAYGDTFAKGGYELGTDTYKTLQWGLEHPIPDEHRALTQLPMTLESLAVEWLGMQSLIRKERAFATDFMTTSVWATDNTSATDWDSTGTPVADVRTAMRAIRQANGIGANAAVMGEIVYDALHANAEIIDLVKYTNSLTKMSRDSLIASVLGVDTLLVSRAMENVANLGQTEDIDPIIDDDVLILRVTPGVDMRGVSSIKTFTWAPGGGQGEVTTYRAQDRRSDIVQHVEQWDQKLVAAATGYFFSDIV